MVAGQLRVSGNLDTSGGSGNFLVFGAGIPSSSCSGGGGGEIQLEAPDMDLSGATLLSIAGAAGNGNRAASGSADLDATTLKMQGESITVGSQLTLTANSTAISAPGIFIT